MKWILTAAATVFVLSGCATGKLDYAKPTAELPQGANVKLIEKPRDKVWAATVPELGKQFFVINNLDKSSGLINISYNGASERYIDCGWITSHVSNARGERTYNFAGASAYQLYEVMGGLALFSIERKMSLEGRVNLVFEEVAPTQTRVTANTRYVVHRQRTIQSTADRIPRSQTDTIGFNFGEAASFPPGSDGRAMECIATGALEREILTLAR